MTAAALAVLLRQIQSPTPATAASSPLKPGGASDEAAYAPGRGEKRPTLTRIALTARDFVALSTSSTPSQTIARFFRPSSSSSSSSSLPSPPPPPPPPLSSSTTAAAAAAGELVSYKAGQLGSYSGAAASFHTSQQKDLEVHRRCVFAAGQQQHGGELAASASSLAAQHDPAMTSSSSSLQDLALTKVSPEQRRRAATVFEVNVKVTAKKKWAALATGVARTPKKMYLKVVGVRPESAAEPAEPVAADSLATSWQIHRRN